MYNDIMTDKVKNSTEKLKEKHRVEDEALRKLLNCDFERTSSMNVWVNGFDTLFSFFLICSWLMVIPSFIFGVSFSVYASKNLFLPDFFNTTLAICVALALVKAFYNTKVVAKNKKPTWSQKFFGLYRVENANVWVNPFCCNRAPFIIYSYIALCVLGITFKGTALETYRDFELFAYNYPVFNVVVGYITIGLVLSGIYYFGRAKLIGPVFLIGGSILGIINSYILSSSLPGEIKVFQAYIFLLVLTILLSIWYFKKLRK